MKQSNKISNVEGFEEGKHKIGKELEGFSFKNEDDEQEKEDQQLIDLYGSKIKVLKWYFENDLYIKTKIKEKKNNINFQKFAAQQYPN